MSNNESDNGNDGGPPKAVAYSKDDGDTEEENADPNNVNSSGVGGDDEDRPPLESQPAKSIKLPKRSEMMRRRSQMNKDGLQFGIPTSTDAKGHVEDRRGKESWQYRALTILHSNKVQMVLLGLLLLDVLVVFSELFLIATFPGCDTIERDAINCCPPPGGERFLAGAEPICSEKGLEPDYETAAGCDEEKWSTVHTAEEGLFAVTLFVLSVFFIELNVEMSALGPCVFFKQFFLALDYVVIGVSLILEVLLHLLEQTALETFVGLVLIIRLWRFVRIGHGIVEITHEVAHREYSKLLTYTEDLETILRDTYHHDKLPENSCHRSGDDLLGEVERDHRNKERKRYSQGGNVGKAKGKTTKAKK